HAHSVAAPSGRRLPPGIPPASVVEAAGTGRFVGTAPAAVDIDRWTIDVRHRPRPGNSIEGFFGGEYIRANEPGSQGNSIPGFGQVSHPSAYILTVTDTQTIGNSSVNELRFGRNKLNGGTFPAT